MERQPISEAQWRYKLAKTVAKGTVKQAQERAEANFYLEL